MKRLHFASLVLSFLLLFTFSRPAFSLTLEEAVSWAYSQEEAFLDLDGRYGAQCSDLATAYLNLLFTGDPFSCLFGVYDACYYPVVAEKNPEWFEVLSPDTALPESGDLFVSVGGDAHAHVGIVLEPLPGGALVLDQNSRRGNYVNGNSAYLHNVTWSGGYTLLSLIRFKKFEEGAPLLLPEAQEDMPGQNQEEREKKGEEGREEAWESEAQEDSLAEEEAWELQWRITHANMKKG